VISKKSLREFWRKHADAKAPLEEWHKRTLKADWNNLSDVRKGFPHADIVGTCVVFNIGGNKYRLIAKVAFQRKIVFVRFVLTHKDYDRGGWKDDCGC
jgi:mRNA interferase HigB